MKTNLHFLFVIFCLSILACNEDDTNSGTKAFTEVQDLSIVQVSQSSIALADFNGDNFLDILITGVRGTFPNDVGISQIYFNNQDGSFSTPDTSPFKAVAVGSVATADVDNDGDQDVLITGADDMGIRDSALYINDGLGDFVEKVTPFEPVSEGSVAFADIDNDGDQDVLISGGAAGFHVTKLYQNDGLGEFTEVMNTPFDQVRFSSIGFSDIDGDSDQDVLISGITFNSEIITKLYKNDGTGTFTEVANTPFDTFWDGDAVFADIDGDNDPDLLISGSTDTNGAADRETKTRLYFNDGSGSFTQMNDGQIVGVASSSIAFGDIDRDNDQDFVIIGSNLSMGSGRAIGNLYINDGSGNFVEDTNATIRNTVDGSIALGDLDNDGDLDLVITGLGNGRETIIYLYD